MKNKLILEQSSRIDLKKAIDTKCIAKYTWIKPDSVKLGRLKDGRDVIAANNTKGEPILFFNDFSVLNTTTKAQAKWECEIPDETLVGTITVKPISPSDIINKY
jgi:hypothetical protein